MDKELNLYLIAIAAGGLALVVSIPLFGIPSSLLEFIIRSGVIMLSVAFLTLLLAFRTL